MSSMEVLWNQGIFFYFMKCLKQVSTTVPQGKNQIFEWFV